MTNGPSLRIVQHADDAYEAIRAINHATIALDGGIPAPIVYQVLGNLKTAGGYGLAQALEQLAGGLGRSLAGYDVYEDDGSDPARTIAHAVDELLRAAADARRVGEYVDRAQSAIAGQGYRRRAADM
jgi:hypothetical protein